MEDVVDAHRRTFGASAGRQHCDGTDVPDVLFTEANS
jgi:hypothetical protein